MIRVAIVEDEQGIQDNILKCVKVLFRNKETHPQRFLIQRKNSWSGLRRERVSDTDFGYWSSEDARN